MRVMPGAAIVCCALFLLGCGIKGPLYLPPISSSSSSAAQQVDEPEKIDESEKADPEIPPETPSDSRHE